MSALLASDIAREFYRTNSAREFGSAQELVAAIDQYMASKGLSGSKIDRLDIASHVIGLQRQQVPTPEQAAWDNFVMQGTTASDELQRQGDEISFRQADERVLAAQVQQMSMPEFAANRERLGLAQSLAGFLGGSE